MSTDQALELSRGVKHEPIGLEIRGIDNKPQHSNARSSALSL